MIGYTRGLFRFSAPLLLTPKYTMNRQRFLEDANLALGVLRFQMRLAKDLQCLNARRIIKGIPISQPVT